MTGATIAQLAATIAPMMLALLAWARLGPDRSRVASEALGDALEQLRTDRDDLRVQLVATRTDLAVCCQRVAALEQQIRAAGLEPAR